MKALKTLVYFYLVRFGFIALAISAIYLFAFWWFDLTHVPTNFTGNFHIFDFMVFGLVTYVIWQPLIMEVLSWVIASHVKDVKKQKPISGLKVAFITTIVPSSEPVELLHKCLPAMVKAEYPHDTWVLDEGNNEEVKNICNLYGVKHFSRYGIPHYNEHEGKFAQKTKGGNHNSWYDGFGDNYDIVAQIDTDFVPKKTFLTETIGYFRDPKIAFVGTPQIYGNTQHSLIAKGAEEQQYNFYGSLLRGLSSMGMTLLIGANHVIRVSALKEVDHYSAHITEDLITGMKLHAKGWKSIYISSALAVGQGPSTWEAYFNQQMRWAYGCMDILFHHSAKLYKYLGLRRTLYYFFLQQHYFSGIVMAVSVCLLSLYFFFGIRAAHVDTFYFLLYYINAMLVCWLIDTWLQRYYVHRKLEGELLLAGTIINAAAWPIWFLAFLCAIFKKRITYKVTPKHNDVVEESINLTTFMPHLLFGIIAVLCLVFSVKFHRQDTVMLFWGTCTALLMLSIPFSNKLAFTVNRTKVNIDKTLRYLLTFSYKKSNEFLHNLPKKNSFDWQVFSTNKNITTAIKPLLTENKNNTNYDYLFLLSVFVISLLPYIGKIGFYSDDWQFLGSFVTSHDHSLIGLIKAATTSNTFMRPIQNILDALLYFCFGTNPLGYQLVNEGILLGVILLFCTVLKKLQLPRIVSTTIPLIYIFLPQYSTDKFWFAAFQANLSILFFMCSLYSGLLALSEKVRYSTFWKWVSILSLLACGLSYEVVLPLVLFNIFIYWNNYKGYTFLRHKNTEEKRNPTIFILLNLIALSYIFVFKALTTTRLGSIQFPNDMIHTTLSVINVHYYFFGLHQLYIIGEILTQYVNIPLFVMTGILYVLIFNYLYGLCKEFFESVHKGIIMRNLTLASVIIFILGYTIFFTNKNIGFSPTGIDNRVNNAASIGVAMTFTALIGWLTQFIPIRRLARFLFATTVALICSSGFLIISTIASFWGNAYQKGQIIRDDIYHHIPYVSKNTTIILDGVCPYIGPAVVFESYWDLKGALQILYKDPSIQADIVTPRMNLTDKGLVTHIYNWTTTYSYKNLLIYNYQQKKVFVVNSKNDAYTYLSKYNPTLGGNCSTGAPGNGVSIF